MTIRSVVPELPEDMRGPEKLRKARKLVVEKRPELGSRVFLVSGHWVNLSDVMVDDCDCADFLYRGGKCKHVLAAELYEESERDEREKRVPGEDRSESGGLTHGEEVEGSGSDGREDSGTPGGVGSVQ